MSGKTARLLRKCGVAYKALKAAWTASPWTARARMREDAEKLAAANRDALRRMP